MLNQWHLLAFFVEDFVFVFLRDSTVVREDEAFRRVRRIGDFDLKYNMFPFGDSLWR